MLDYLVYTFLNAAAPKLNCNGETADASVYISLTDQYRYLHPWCTETIYCKIASFPLPNNIVIFIIIHFHPQRLIVVAEVFAEQRAASAVGSVFWHFKAEGNIAVIINM